VALKGWGGKKTNRQRQESGGVVVWGRSGGEWEAPF